MSLDVTSYCFESTSDEVMYGLGHLAKDKHAIVTGANIGLGFETARSLAKHGAVVTIACRSIENGTECIAKILADTPEAKVSFLQLNLGSFDSIRAFIASYKASKQPLHLLINNAGVMGCPLTFTADGLETHFGVNHVGHFLLTTELLDLMKSSGTAESPARVVNVSSRGHYWCLLPDVGIPYDDLKGEANYDPWVRYGASKLANILFTQELQRRLDNEHCNSVIAVVLHPGGIYETGLVRHLDPNITAQSITAIFKRPGADASKRKNIKQGTATTLVCALRPDIVKGGYYSDCQEETKFIHEKTFELNEQVRLWEVSEQLVAQKSA